MNLYLVRHGKTCCNLKEKYIGSFEDDLSEQGIREIKKVKEITSKVHFDKVFSSERSRAYHSAMLLTDNEIIKDYRLNERDFGIFENKTYGEICYNYPEERKAWEEEWMDYKIPHGESAKECYDRAAEFMKMLEKQNYENCLAVTHGGIIRSIYCYILGGDLNNFWKFTSRNGSISVVKFQYNYWYIDSMVQLSSMGDE